MSALMKFLPLLKESIPENPVLPAKKSAGLCFFHYWQYISTNYFL